MNQQQRVAYGNLWMGIGIMIGSLLGGLAGNWPLGLLIGFAIVVFSFWMLRRASS